MHQTAPTIYTIGHSTRELDEFVGELVAHEVNEVVDVRTIPRSRHNPQYNKETLPDSLSAAGIGYTHMPGLGGLRRPRKDSPNAGWRNASFRGYADYMQTDEFRRSIGALLALAEGKRVAVMCAEVVPWRCHRSLVADALEARGARVKHIVGRGTSVDHKLTPWAVVRGDVVVYPSSEFA